jgi:hypothetical protein
MTTTTPYPYDSVLTPTDRPLHHYTQPADRAAAAQRYLDNVRWLNLQILEHTRDLKAIELYLRHSDAHGEFLPKRAPRTERNQPNPHARGQATDRHGTPHPMPTHRLPHRYVLNPDAPADQQHAYVFGTDDDDSPTTDTDDPDPEPQPPTPTHTPDPGNDGGSQNPETQTDEPQNDTAVNQVSIPQNILFDSTRHPRQRDFLQTVWQAAHRHNPYRQLLYGGGIRGGKTYACLAAAVLIALEFPGVRIHIVRRTLQTLQSATWPSLRKLLPHPCIRHLRKGTSEWTLTLHNGSEICLFSECHDSDPDLDRFKGLETNVIILEQVEELQAHTFDKALERVGSWHLRAGPAPPHSYSPPSTPPTTGSSTASTNPPHSAHSRPTATSRTHSPPTAPTSLPTSSTTGSGSIPSSTDASSSETGTPAMPADASGLPTNPKSTSSPNSNPSPTSTSGSPSTSTSAP